MGRRIGSRRREERTAEKARQEHYRELEKARRREQARRYDDERKAAEAVHKAEMESIRPTIERLEQVGVKAAYIGHYWSSPCSTGDGRPVYIKQAFVLSEDELLRLLERTDG